MTRRAKADEVIRSTSISFQATTVGETMRASIELIIVEKAFHAIVILSTNTEISIIPKTQPTRMVDADLMISNW